MKSSNGNPMVKLSLKTVWPDNHRNVDLRDQVVLTDAALWKFKGLCQATVGDDGKPLLSDDGKRFIGKSVKDFEGNVVTHKIKHEPWNDEMRNKIDGGYSAGYRAREITGAQSQAPVAPAPGGAPMPPNFGQQ